MADFQREEENINRFRKVARLVFPLRYWPENGGATAHSE